MRTLLLTLVAVALAGCDRNPATPTEVVLVPPPIIASFTADATRLGPPNGNTLDTFLRWSVIGDSRTSCRIDANIGDVPLAGFVQVRPGLSRDYALSCTNSGGTVVRIVSIIVA